MPKLLSDDELREALAPFVYGKRDLEKVISVIQSQKKAYAEMNESFIRSRLERVNKENK